MTDDDEDEEQVLSNDFAGLIDQLDSIRIAKRKLSLNHLKRLQHLHEVHSKEISTFAEKLDKIENEKKEMAKEREERLKQLCEIHSKETATLSLDGFRGKNDSTWGIVPFMRYETLRTIHSREYKALNSQIDSHMNDIKKKLLQCQLRLEALSNTEMKYRELKSNYTQQLHDSFPQEIVSSSTSIPKW